MFVCLFLIKVKTTELDRKENLPQSCNMYSIS